MQSSGGHDKPGNPKPKCKSFALYASPFFTDPPPPLPDDSERREALEFLKSQFGARTQAGSKPQPT